MQSSISVERGATTLQNLWAMIRYEANSFGLLSEQRSSALYVFTKPCFPDVHGIEPIHLRSTLFQPFGTTRTFRSPFWPILLFLGRFWGPLGQIWGHPASQNWSIIFNLDLPNPVPPSFHAVPTVWDHQSLQIAKLGPVGPSWAVFGAPGPNLGAPSFSKLVQLGQVGPFLGPWRSQI